MVPKHPHESRKDICLCKTANGLYLPTHQVGYIVSCLVISSTLLCTSTYYMGRRHAAQEFIAPIIHACADEDRLVAQQEAACIDAPIIENVQDVSDVQVRTNVSPDTNASLVTPVDVLAPAVVYKAELIGFGNAKSAQQFAQRMHGKGFEVEVKKRSSKTARGRVIHWYQVVTCAYQEKEQLERHLAPVIKQERLKDVRIVACSSLSSSDSSLPAGQIT